MGGHLLSTMVFSLPMGPEAMGPGSNGTDFWSPKPEETLRDDYLKHCHPRLSQALSPSYNISVLLNRVHHSILGLSTTGIIWVWVKLQSYLEAQLSHGPLLGSHTLLGELTPWSSRTEGFMLFPGCHLGATFTCLTHMAYTWPTTYTTALGIEACFSRWPAKSVCVSQFVIW